MFSAAILERAARILDRYRSLGLKVAMAESCTAGLVAAALTEFGGASDVFERGFVTYTNRAKQELLGVPGELIADLGAVSEPVARMMAEGALEASNAHISVAITGIAGPGGGTSFKPVGTVHIATARSNQGLMHRQEFFQLETRTEIQLAAVEVALQALRDRIS